MAGGEFCDLFIRLVFYIENKRSCQAIPLDTFYRL